jgi:hypothetical protein
MNGGRIVGKGWLPSDLVQSGGQPVAAVAIPTLKGLSAIDLYLGTG